jgi:aerobic carbon-monoxide dehydrogenase small subunit
MASKSPVKFLVNGHPAEVPCADERILLDLLREELNLTGTKRGCDLGTCGCCTVLIDGRPTLSCLTLARLAEGRAITTIEGIGSGGQLHPVQRAFVEHGATQCGFCTPGFVVAAVSLLERDPHPSREAVIEALSGNLCRCTGYTKIIEAVLAASGAP